MGNWRSRRRDPAVTRRVRLPWSAEDPCPCGADRLYANCCGKLSLQSPYKQIVEFRPPGAPTGYSHPRCYMGWTHNCSPTISGEHFISENVLSILNPKSVRISGAAWIRTGQSLDLPLSALQANILCERHNSALSPLDTMAGNLFRAVDGIYENLSRPRLSRRPIWHLFSGEELELWLLKTILGFLPCQRALAEWAEDRGRAGDHESGHRSSLQNRISRRPMRYVCAEKHNHIGSAPSS